MGCKQIMSGGISVCYVPKQKTHFGKMHVIKMALTKNLGFKEFLKHLCVLTSMVDPVLHQVPRIFSLGINCQVLRYDCMSYEVLEDVYPGFRLPHIETKLKNYNMLTPFNICELHFINGPY